MCSNQQVYWGKNCTWFLLKVVTRLYPFPIGWGLISGLVQLASFKRIRAKTMKERGKRGTIEFPYVLRMQWGLCILKGLTGWVN